MSDFQIKDSGDFLKLSKALKKAGRTELRKELNKGLKNGAKPLIPKTREEARSTLPQGGGLADTVARSPMRVQVRTGAATAGVRVVVGNSRSGARAANRGQIRHPVFGNRDAWVTQKVPREWFDRPMRLGAPLVRPALEQAMQRVIDDIVRGAR